ncbi:MAG: hypothetical protein KGI29_07460 [Pseudomonadota bacterium]|nr:hypothetical protein [Pseudomonadota bacterium]MDE3037736.1 hypothetical protein [Pseudomonadota bacterium]
MLMRALRNTSIKWRLTMIIMAVSFISVMLTTLAISINSVYNQRLNIIKDLDVSATIVGDRNVAALQFDDYSQTDSNLQIFRRVKKTIVQACLYDHLSVVGAVIDKNVAHYVNPRYAGNTQCPAALGDYVHIENERVHLMKPVVDNGNKIIGYLYIESTLEEIDDYIAKQTTIALTVALAALFVSYLLAVSLQKAISRPILSLAEVAREVSRRRDYSIRAASLGDATREYNNELVTLTHSFNDMLTEIGARDRQLKQQNVELEKARDAAESANRAKSQFLANISHELRTPLNAIIGFSSILMNQLFGVLGDQKYLEYSKDINESGTHLLDIINDILDLSKAEAGKLDLTYEEIHIGKAVNKCVTILSERAGKGKIAITTDVPKILPPLMADRLRFIQVVLNIVSNAVKFTEEGGKVHIAVRADISGNRATRFIITVQDSGIGMSKEDIEKAFQSFGQVDSGLNRKYEGTGLGLPLTKKLVDMHHGDMRIDSEVGRGTLVTLTFPAAPPGGLPQEE